MNAVTKILKAAAKTAKRAMKTLSLVPGKTRRQSRHRRRTHKARKF